MMAIQEREHVHHIKLEMKMSIKPVAPMSGGAIFAIVLTLLLFFAAVAAVFVLWLNKIGIISIYVPKELRVFCLKDYLSYEEEQIR